MNAKHRGAVTPGQRDLFLEGLADGLSVVDAATAAGASRRGLYRLRAADPDFAAEWAQGWDEGADLLEQEARRRAVEGVDDFKGDYPVTRYSDTLLIFLLKARRPSTFARFELTGPAGGPIEVTVEPSADHLARVASLLAEAGALRTREEPGT